MPATHEITIKIDEARIDAAILRAIALGQREDEGDEGDVDVRPPTSSRR